MPNFCEGFWPFLLGFLETERKVKRVFISFVEVVVAVGFVYCKTVNSFLKFFRSSKLSKVV